MMLTIHGLPPNMNYQDLKAVVIQECKMTEFVLGSLEFDEDGTQRVKIGLSDDKEGNVLMKCLDGYRLSGHIIRIVPVVKSACENFKLNTFNDSSYKRKRNQQVSNYDKHSKEPIQNWTSHWSNGKANPQWTVNQQKMPDQIQTMGSFGFVQPPPGPYQEQPVFHQPQRGNQSRTNEEKIEELTNRQSVHSGSHSTLGYNNDKLQTLRNDNHQEPYIVGTGTQPNQGQQGHYQGQGYGQQWTAVKKVEPFAKHSPSQFEKFPFNNESIHLDKRQDILHDQGKNTDYSQYDGKRRYSPKRDQRQPLPGHRVSSPPGHRVSSPAGHRISPSGHRILPSGRRISPPPQRMSPSSRGLPPFDPIIATFARRKLSPSGQRVSPFGRRISPTCCRISPSDHVMSQSGRELSPCNRRISPLGRRISPSNCISPSRRRISPSRISPDRKDPEDEISMGQRLSSRRMSPGRCGSPHRGHSPGTYSRYSASPIDKYRDNLRQSPIKDVRPAYERISQAPNSPIYSGGYPSNENAPYVISVSRQTEQRPLWQDKEEGYPSSSKLDDDRRDLPEIQKIGVPRGLDYTIVSNQPETKKKSPSRRSRSPNQRECSPIRDRYKRHSPSPRFPRRSWDLENKRTLENREEPPSPFWPDRQENSNREQNMPNKESNIPVWEIPYEAKGTLSIPNKKEDRGHEHEDFVSPSRSRWDLRQKPTPQAKEPKDPSLFPLKPIDHYTQIQREHQISPRHEYDTRHRNEFLNHEPPDREQWMDGEFSDTGKQGHDNFRLVYDDYHLRMHERKNHLHMRHEDFDIEINDVFKRAAELTKKTEEYQRKRNAKLICSNNTENHRIEKHDVRVYTYDTKKVNRDDAHANRTPESSNRKFYTSQSRHDRTPRFSNDTRNDLSPGVQYKRDKAVDVIMEQMLLKFAPDLEEKTRYDVEARLKITIEEMIFEMFGETDVSFIEIVVKFENRYKTEDLQHILDSVISQFPVEIRRMKRSEPDIFQSPVKSHDWNLNTLAVGPTATVVQQPLITTVPMMVSMPYALAQPVAEHMMLPQIQEGYRLYMCKDNFQAINETHTSYLKDFIINEIIKTTESGTGWAPDLTLRGVRNEIHYEVWTCDQQSKDWLMNLDFKDFSYFNVLVFTPDELWYERAAIWLPGHSRKPLPSPLTKLKLQNRYLEDIKIDMWKLVKHIVKEKGTRLYVDIPPSSARALEKHNMTLSYELQKVKVFLKAVAADKDAFDAGLEEMSIKVTPDLYKQNTHMPSINSQESSVVKFCLSGKSINLSIARRIKDTLIWHIYKYVQEGGTRRTDFLKYGFCKPGYFCVVAENEETAKWVSSIDMGKINGHNVTVYGSNSVNAKYVTMVVSLPYDHKLTPKKVLEKFKTSNRGVKGLKFNLWKNGHVCPSNYNTKSWYRIDVDMESADTLIELNFSLHYLVENRIETVYMKPDMSITRLKDMVEEFKVEANDSLDVTNMEISSSDDDNIICLD